MFPGVGISDPEYHVVRSSGLVSYQILYTRSGAGVLEIDGRKLPQIPGSIFLVAPGVPHEYYPQQCMWETAWVVFRGACIRELMTNLGFGDWNERSGAELSGCDGIFARLLSAASDPLNGGERCSLLVYEYILEARSVLLGGAKRPGGQSDRAVEFIERHFSEDITLDQLAGITGVSLQHFCRIFRGRTECGRWSTSHASGYQRQSGCSAPPDGAWRRSRSLPDTATLPISARCSEVRGNHPDRVPQNKNAVMFIF